MEQRFQLVNRNISTSTAQATGDKLGGVILNSIITYRVTDDANTI